MAQIGNFGSSVVFKVSDKQVMSFRNFTRTVKAKWTEHPGIGVKPASEFVAPELDNNTLEIVLNAGLGVRPRTVINTLEGLCRNGRAEYLVIGNQRVGSGKYYISSLSEAWNTIYNKGELYEATVSVTFNEYGG